MGEIEILEEEIKELRSELKELSIQFELFKLKFSGKQYQYPDTLTDNPFVYNKRDFT